jgi:KTSC domain/DnaJ domain
MKKISDARILLGVDKTAELKDLKGIYRNLMKEWHPDKFQDGHEHKLTAEEKSKEIIDAYHFLVSIAPETAASTLAEYKETTAVVIRDFSFKAQTLEINFADGNNYEYFDVPRNTYQKMVNSDSPGRFARRHIFHSFVYRKISKQEVAASY